ncbi:MAG: hypothetical protein ACT4P3_12675 [Betaproteobacteria bacterium]
MTAEPARSIEKLGFKRWYERQLLESHAWLVTCILSGLAVCAVLELHGLRVRSLASVLTLAFVYLAGVMCWHGLKRYRAIMGEAERLSEQSTCRSCNTYAAFDLTREAPLSARCRKCGNEWRLE